MSFRAYYVSQTLTSCTFEWFTAARSPQTSHLPGDTDGRRKGVWPKDIG
ncbi:hypothetical protein L0665_03895 [Methanogenium marinum]|uniref:Uncharacterized protein n=1 Tax=Methanogenium marinum TaxID=348610 RepID=A0A9Q4KSH0_9EURY|nr:hypothetical protein [Methanogenium marinum]MDE4907754.1 hypothetical protein [Methanogenium marinum]